MMVSVEDAQLFFTTRGRGPACLVLCSLGTRIYERQLPAALDDHLTLAFVDLRGSGRSTGDPAALTFDRLAADLEAHPLEALIGRATRRNSSCRTGAEVGSTVTATASSLSASPLNVPRVGGTSS